jgi:hypothetical protein
MIAQRNASKLTSPHHLYHAFAPPHCRLCSCRAERSFAITKAEAQRWNQTGQCRARNDMRGITQPVTVGSKQPAKESRGGTSESLLGHDPCELSECQPVFRKGQTVRRPGCGIRSDPLLRMPMGEPGGQT